LSSILGDPTVTRSPEPDDILRRIKLDLIDEYDEELELEIEDRTAEDVLAPVQGARGDPQREARLKY
jgi:hypothetical protein